MKFLAGYRSTASTFGLFAADIRVRGEREAGVRNKPSLSVWGARRRHSPTMAGLDVLAGW